MGLIYCQHAKQCLNLEIQRLNGLWKWKCYELWKALELGLNHVVFVHNQDENHMVPHETKVQLTASG